MDSKSLKQAHTWDKVKTNTFTCSVESKEDLEQSSNKGGILNFPRHKHLCRHWTRFLRNYIKTLVSDSDIKIIAELYSTEDSVLVASKTPSSITFTRIRGVHKWPKVELRCTTSLETRVGSSFKSLGRMVILSTTTICYKAMANSSLIAWPCWVQTVASSSWSSRPLPMATGLIVLHFQFLKEVAKYLS